MDRLPVSVQDYNRTPEERRLNWQRRYDAAIETVKRCQQMGLVHAEADTLGYILWLWQRRPR